jgi:hypothetical protein
MHVFTHFWCREIEQTVKNRFQELRAVSLQVHVHVVGIYCRYCSFQIQSNLGSRTPRITNNSVYEHIFGTQSVSDDYCVSSYEHASRQHRGAISWEYQRRQYS